MWIGQPEKNGLRKTHIFILVASGLFALIFATLWNFVVWTNKTPIFFRIFGLLLLFSSAFGGIIHILLHKYRRSKIHYAISNERIYIEYLFFKKHIKSYKIKALPKPKMKRYSNGIGTILINYERPFTQKVLSFGIEYHWFDQYRRLEFIEDYLEVFNLIIELRK